jgi:hypothetical protein
MTGDTGMTVLRLRQFLAALPDDMPIALETDDESCHDDWTCYLADSVLILTNRDDVRPLRF